MEKRKKRNIITVALIVVLFVGMLFLLVSMRKGFSAWLDSSLHPEEKVEYTFEQITQGLSEKVDHVRYEDSTLSEELTNQYYDYLKEKNYVYISNPGPQELSVRVLCYDEDDNLLFTVNVYRYGHVKLKIESNGNIYFYHFHT